MMQNNAQAQAHLQKAIWHFNARQWVPALDELVVADRYRPGIPQVLILRSYVESYLGHYRAAREAAMAAAEGIPDGPETIGDVFARLRTFNQGGRLVEYIRQLGGAANLSIPNLLQAAAQLSYLNLQEEALELLYEAETADPNYPPTQLSMAQILVYVGKGEEALDRLRSVLRRAPEISDTYWLLAQLGTQLRGKIGMDPIQIAFNQLRRPGLQSKDRIHLGFALHRMLDEAGQTDEAFACLEDACMAKRATLATAHVQLLATLKVLRERHPRIVRNKHSGALLGPMPIFIIGMHRSGTTLLEQMLDGHLDVQGVGELYDFTSAMRYQTDHHCPGVTDETIVQRASGSEFDAGAVGERYLQGVAWRLDGKRYFTDKLPSNFLNAGFICEALPQAKLLHMVRDPVEVCFSNLRELFSSANPYSYDQIELADFYIEYHKLMAHWRKTYPGRIFDIRYDRMVRDPEAVMREVCEFCALEFTPEMLAIGNRKRGVSTASAVQVREGIQVRDVPKWKPYETYLQPMITRLRQGGVLEGWEQA